VNRTGIFATALLACTLPAAIAVAQTALVVGSVRDQHGAAVARASVTAFGPSGTRVGFATTDAAGTFALPAAGVTRLAIACRYCMPAEVPVLDGQPAVAIVRRFDALFDDSPSSADFANLPYAHVESAMALRPYALLRQTTAALPGSQLSDRGLSPSDALLVDAGVPNYDFVDGTSPYATIPQAYQQTGALVPPEDAFAYGDRAGSGIVALDPFDDGNAGAASTGGDQTLRLQAGSDYARVVAATYSNASESRQRSDAEVEVPLSTAQTLAFSGGTSQGRDYGDPQSALDSSFSFARALFDDAQPNGNIYASYVADRGGYGAALSGTTLSDVWSDSNFTAGARSRGPIAFFADASDRLSTGIYDDSYYAQPRIAGTLTQTRFDAGIDATSADVDVSAGIGWFGVGFTGGTDGTSAPASAHLATPSVLVQLFPSSKWSANVGASGSFTLPDLWQQYAPDDGDEGLVYDRNALYDATLTYTDDARLRVSLEGASQHVAGFTNGTVTSTGVSVAWQVAPAISLRAWTMHVDDTTATSPPYIPFYPSGTPATVNAFWLTYDNGGALRVDAIYRRDVLNGAPFEHVDGDVSGPISGRLRWYAGVEDRQRTTYLDVGLRFTAGP
jgi:hypothetical protein